MDVCVLQLSRLKSDPKVLQLEEEAPKVSVSELLKCSYCPSARCYFSKSYAILKYKY